MTKMIVLHGLFNDGSVRSTIYTTKFHRHAVATGNLVNGMVEYVIGTRDQVAAFKVKSRQTPKAPTSP